MYKFLTNLTIDQLLVQLQDLIRWLQSSRQIFGHNRRKTCLAHQEKYPHLGKPAIFLMITTKVSNPQIPLRKGSLITRTRCLRWTLPCGKQQHTRLTLRSESITLFASAGKWYVLNVREMYLSRERCRIS